MEYSKIEESALTIKNLYDRLNKKEGEDKWTYREYAEGLMGDLGDLMKMLMAKSNLR